MLKFISLKYRNFLSTGSKFTEIDLACTSTTLIVGNNGSGKSTLLDALSFVLFGKPHRNINKPQLINSINEKNCLVECEFDINNSKYKVVRGIKPAIFEIHKDGKLLNQESHSRDYQKILEQNIIKLNHKSFHQVVVLGSSNFVPFMKLPSHARREVIEDLLDIRVIGKMAQLHKSNVGVHIENAKQVDVKIKQTEERIKMQKEHLEKLRDIRDQDKQSVEKELNTERAEEFKFQNEVITLTKALSDLTIDKVRDDLKNANADIAALKKDASTREGVMSSYEKTRVFMQTNESCPTCEQEIAETTRQEKISDCGHNINSQAVTIIDLKGDIEKIETNIEELEHVINSAHEINVNLKLASDRSASCKKRVEKLEGDRDKNSISSEDIEEASTKLQLSQDRLTLGMKAKETLSNQRRYNAVITELLRDTGIKAKVIKQYLDPMNTLINKYLSVLDFFVLFNLDENFTETIRSRHRDDFSYASFSEGEKQRIDLALLFAWRHISKMKNSVNTNLLILDETFDSSLDAAGVDNLLKILGTLPEETRTFIISHKRDLLEGKFERRLEFEKHLNFSRLSASTL